MKLSIITINYNNAVGLQRTLESVRSQNLSPLAFRPDEVDSPKVEHIIVDGASSDNSVDIIRQYADCLGERRKAKGEVDSAIGQRPNIHQSAITVRWINEHDSGIYNAMNKGIEIALGHREVDSFNRSTIGDKTKGGSEEPDHYIQILNSGDCLYSDHVIADMCHALQDSGYPGIMYGNMIRDFDGKIRKRDCGMEQHEWTMNDFIRGTINHDPTYIRSDLYRKYGLYDENLKICSDWKWFVTAVVFGGEKPVYVPIDVTLFDVTGISETQLDFREREREQELRKLLPEAVLKDYWTWHFPIEQIKRLKRYHLWGAISFVERVLNRIEHRNFSKRKK